MTGSKDNSKKRAIYREGFLQADDLSSYGHV